MNFIRRHIENYINPVFAFGRKRIDFIGSFESSSKFYKHLSPDCIQIFNNSTELDESRLLNQLLMSINVCPII